MALVAQGAAARRAAIADGLALAVADLIPGRNSTKVEEANRGITSSFAQTVIIQAFAIMLQSRLSI
jgi:hypothetical protein